MKAFILATDDTRRPTKSALLTGPEMEDDAVRRKFYAHRADGYHPDGWAVLTLFGERGMTDISVAKYKDAAAKETALKADAKKAAAEKESIEKAEAAERARVKADADKAINKK